MRGGAVGEPWAESLAWEWSRRLADGCRSGEAVRLVHKGDLDVAKCEQRVWDYPPRSERGVRASATGVQAVIVESLTRVLSESCEGR